MIDFITAIWGSKHCGWCFDKPPTRWEKLMRQDQILDRNTLPWWEKAADKWGDFTYWTKVWRLGEMWHRRFHRDRNLAG